MIKVMHVCSDTNIGGAGRYLLNLLEASDKQQFETLFVLPTNSKLKPLLEKSGGKIIEAAIAPDQSFNKKDIGILRKLMKDIKPDIIHTHASLSARIAGKLAGARGVIYTRHYVDTSCMNNDVKKKASLKENLKKAFNNSLCDGVIGVAYECEPVLLEMGIAPDKIKIIPNGVMALPEYDEATKLAIKAKYGISPTHKVITIMARLSKEKGHDIFIDVMQKVVAAYPQCTGLIGGTGPEEAHIKELIQKKGLEDVVKMAGFVEDVASIHNVATIQMNTSYTEAQSLALSEGMSLGVPAVVTDTGGNPSMIRHQVNGYVAPVADVEALAADVIQLLKDDENYEVMCNEAKQIYEAHYTAREMTKSTEAFYREILKRKKR